MPTEDLPRVLVVEDEPDMNRLLALVLRAFGMEPVPALDAEEALRRLGEGPVDAVLLDLMLPGMSGYDLCRRLKADPATRAVPVVILTALDQPEHRRRALEAGADDYLTKPFDPEVLAARLRAALKTARPGARPRDG